MGLIDDATTTGREAVEKRYRPVPWSSRADRWISRHEERSDGAGWLPIIVVCLSDLVVVVNLVAVTTMMRPVVDDLGTTLSSVELTIVAYSIFAAAFAIDGAKICPRVGFVRMELLGLGLFAAGMLLAGFANSVNLLVAGQAVAGIGGGLLLANGTAIIGHVYADRRQRFAVSLQAALTGIGCSLGLLSAGALATSVNWRAPFFLMVSVLVVAMGLTWRLRLPRPKAPPPRLDGPSIVLAAIGIIAFVGAVNQAGAWGLVVARPAAPWTLFGLSPVVVLLVLGGALLRWFLKRQRELRAAARDPLLAPEVTQAALPRACISSLVVANGTLTGVLFLLLLYSEVVFGHTPLESALTLLPIALSVLAGNLVSFALFPKVAPRTLVSGALIVSAVGTFLLALSISNDVDLRAVFPGAILVGLGLGVAVPASEKSLVASVPSELAADAGAARSATMFLGNALGTSLSTAVLLWSLARAAAVLVEGRPELSLPNSVELSLTTTSFVSNNELRALLAGPPWDLDPAQIDAAVEINVRARLFALRAGLVALGLLLLLDLAALRALPARYTSAARPSSLA